MVKSIRQQIMDALKAQLASISTANGYQNNLGTSTLPGSGPAVFRWRVTDLQEPELPGINLKDTDDTRALAVGSDIHSLNVQIEITSLGATSADDLTSLIADVVTALGADPTFGGLASDTVIKSDKMMFAQKEHLIGAVAFAIEIQYVTLKFNAYQ